MKPVSLSLDGKPVGHFPTVTSAADFADDCGIPWKQARIKRNGKLVCYRKAGTHYNEWVFPKKVTA